MSERVILVTGSTDGIGRAAARALAAAGAHVIVHGRSKAKVDATLTALRAELPGATLAGVAFDLGSLAAVRRGAAELLAATPALHVVIHNAGVFATERVLTADQIELTFAVNCVGPFLLTELLMPRLLESGAAAGEPSRVINVASIAHTRGALRFDDLSLEKGFTGYAAYAQSKLANVVHALALADRHPPTALLAYSAHPGVIGTKLLRQGFGPIQGGTVEHGARGLVRLATGAAEPSGTYLSDGVVTPPSTVARDPANRAPLWDALTRLAKL